MLKLIKASSLALMAAVTFSSIAHAHTQSIPHRSVVIRVFYNGGIKESFWRSELPGITPLQFIQTKTYIKEVKKVKTPDGSSTINVTRGSVSTGVTGTLTQNANGEESLILNVSYLVRMNPVTSHGLTIDIPVVRTLSAKGILYRHHFESQNGRLGIIVATTSR